MSEEAVQALGAAIDAAQRIVCFTGAGISTESGIPDFRSPGTGLWNKIKPIQFQDFIASEEARRELENRPAITIQGFKQGTRTFGEVRCFPAVINDRVEGAVAVIHRTHHDESIIELIAPTHLRSSLGLGEGSDVKVTITFRR